MARDLLGQAVFLDLHGGTPYPQALALPLSYMRAYFESEVFTHHSKAKEGQAKLDVAVIGRLDALIKAFGNFARALSRR